MQSTVEVLLKYSMKLLKFPCEHLRRDKRGPVQTMTGMEAASYSGAFDGDEDVHPDSSRQMYSMSMNPISQVPHVIEVQ